MDVLEVLSRQARDYVWSQTKLQVLGLRWFAIHLSKRSANPVAARAESVLLMELNWSFDLASRKALRRNLTNAERIELIRFLGYMQERAPERDYEAAIAAIHARWPTLAALQSPHPASPS